MGAIHTNQELLGPGHFTPERVKSILDRVLKKGHFPELGDPILEGISNQLNDYKHDFQLRTQHWKEAIEHRTRLVASLKTLEEVLPHLLNEVGQAAGYANEEGNQPLLRTFRDTANVIVQLGLAVEATNNCALLTSPTTRVSDREWKTIARDLMRMLQTAIPTATDAAAYRFIASVTRDITGETPTEEAVSSHIKKGR